MSAFFNSINFFDFFVFFAFFALFKKLLTTVLLKGKAN
jgi:hypothetical protein